MNVKWLSSFLSITMLSLTFASMHSIYAEGSGGTFGGGSGTASDPYIIEDVYDLQAISVSKSSFYILKNDIDASVTKTWTKGFTPRGTFSSPFTGSLDGENYTITNLYINRTDYAGLFGWTKDGVVKNLIIKDCYVNGFDRVGIIAASASGTFLNCHVHGIVKGYKNVGGFFGHFQSGSATNCTTNVNINATDSVGGFVGRNYGILSGCEAIGDIPWGSEPIGGLAGYNGGEISNCSARGNVTGSYQVGGLVGESLGRIKDSHAAGNVHCLKWICGGLVGSSGKSEISNCYATGNVVAESSVGGLIGEVKLGRILNSYSTGNVTGGELFGGLVGIYTPGSEYPHSSFTNSHYNIDEVKINGKKQLTIGGIYDSQYGDWISHGLSLNISDYSKSLISDNGCFNISDMQGLKDLLGFTETTNKYRLVKDIDLGSYPGFFIPHFTSHFDGCNNTISNLSLVLPSKYLGMFGIVEGYNNSVKNMILQNVEIRGYAYAGGLLGYMEWGLISNCTVSGVVNSSYNAGGLAGILTNYVSIGDCHARVRVETTQDRTGGLASELTGFVSNCTASGDVISDHSYSGGLCGYATSAYIDKCIASGNVSGSDYVGGLFGYLEKGILTDNVAYGNVNGKSFVGGLCGWCSSPQYSTGILRCSAFGKVVGSEYVGGLLGTGSQVTECFACGEVEASIGYCGGLVGVGGKITRCFAKGNVSNSGYYTGGLVGFLSEALNNCYSAGGVIGNDNTGGLVGFAYYNTRIYNCYSMGSVYSAYSCGGLVGNTYGTVEDSYWDTQTSGQNASGGGTGKTTSEMMRKATFSGWDFSNVWGIIDNATYPFLRMEDTGPPTADAGEDQTLHIGSGGEVDAVFNGSGSSDDIGIADYIWSFEYGGETIVLDGPVAEFSFDSVGSFNVTLNVTDVLGFWNEDELTVNVDDLEPPTAYAGPDQRVNEGTVVTFDGRLSQDNLDIVRYIWTIRDNSPKVLEGVTVAYTFDDPGEFTVELNITDSFGNYDIDTMVVMINDITPPLAEAGEDITVDENTVVTFKGYESMDNVGVYNISWSFIDKIPVLLFGENASYRFDDPGIFEVTLKVTDRSWNSGIDTLIVTVLDTTDPIADAGIDMLVTEDVPLKFDGSKSMDNVGIVSFGWTVLLDDETVNLNGIAPEFTFADPGTFFAFLNVTDAAGHYDIDQVNITVKDATRPIANAGDDLTIPVGTNVSFDASSSTDNGEIEDFSWTFEYDGGEVVLKGESSAFVFGKGGTYDINLRVTDAYGNSCDDALVVTVVDTGRIHGIVIDEKGGPVQGAKIEIISSNDAKYTAISGSNGSFSLEIFHGKFKWIISMEGYISINGNGSVEAMGTYGLDISEATLVRIGDDGGEKNGTGQGSNEDSNNKSVILITIASVIVLLIVLGISIFAFIKIKNRRKIDTLFPDESSPERISSSSDILSDSDVEIGNHDYSQAIESEQADSVLNVEEKAPQIEAAPPQIKENQS